MRDNASRADNQQERLEKIPTSTAHYFSGFVDGEGSFNVALIPRKEYRFGWKIYLTFNVAQKDPSTLKLMQKYFGVGRLEQRKDGVWNYSVNDFLLSFCPATTLWIDSSKRVTKVMISK